MECAVDQNPDIFWEGHDIMFDLNQRGWNQTSSQEFANRLNVNYGEMLNCVEDAEQVLTGCASGAKRRGYRHTGYSCALW